MVQGEDVIRYRTVYDFRSQLDKRNMNVVLFGFGIGRECFCYLRDWFKCPT